MSHCDMKRIEALRQAALQPVISYDRFYLRFFERYAGNEALGPIEKRYADAYTYALSGIQPVIGEHELIVGRSPAPLSESEAARWAELRRTVADPLGVAVGQDSHMAIDYETLLREGTDGLTARIGEKRAAEKDEGKRAFYALCAQCLGAVADLADRYADHACALARACGDPARAAELDAIGAICRRVPRHPARTFYEAVQSAHFVTFCLGMNPYRYFGMQQFQLGRPDRYLYPYYVADKKAGRLTDDEAQTLLDCLAIQINNRVPNGLSCGYMLGGRDREGHLVANELTKMGLQVIDDIRLVYPSVGLCWSEGQDESLIRQACDILSHGRSHPAIFNDDVISGGLGDYGVTPAERHDYIHSTCVEITPIAASNVWVASPYTNMVQLLLDLLDREWPSFDALMAALYRHLDQSIKANFDEQNAFRALRSQRTINPLLSCFVNDCIERGMDIERGGARYNWIMPSFVGMANLIDSLEVIRELIFTRGEMTFAELRAMLDADFQGYEPQRLRLLNGVDKYGNDIDRVDSLFGELVGHIIDECRKYTPLFDGSRLIPSVFCWVMHEHFGRQTGASPDGRHAGFPLGDGSGPCQGREKNGPTASILSSTKWPHRALIGGVAVNMKFSKSTFTADSCARMADLILTYMRRGGFEIQINVVDRDTLLDAQRHPEAHRDLVVRIGGYSDYFTRLSPQMQSEVLARTAHEA